MAEIKKTGLQEWADAHDSSDIEIMILMLSEGQAPGALIGDARYCGAPLPGGRDKALEMLLGRGRAGNISINRDVLASVLTAAAVEGYYQDNIPAQISSDRLPDLINAIYCGNDELRYSIIPERCKPDTDSNNDNNSGSELEPKSGRESAAEPIMTVTDPVTADAELKPEAGAADPVTADAELKPEAGAAGHVAPVSAATQKKKKTKYSVSKAAAKNLVSAGDSKLSSRDLRSFLISMGIKAQDIALMGDAEAEAAFSKDYMNIDLGRGTVILDRQGYERLIDLLSTEAYCVAAREGDAVPAADSGSDK